MAVVTAVVRTNWSGTTGGPGLTQLCIEGKTDPHSWDAAAAQVAVDAVRAMWQASRTYIPDNIKLDVSPVVDVYTNVDGQLVGSYAAPVVPAQTIGSATTNFSMASGVKVNLNTGQIRNGRRVRGSVFIVPSSGDTFTTDGLVTALARSGLNAAFQAMINTLSTNNKQLVVWSRPLPASDPKGPRIGGTTPVANAETSEKGAILRGRRD